MAYKTGLALLRGCRRKRKAKRARVGGETRGLASEDQTNDDQQPGIWVFVPVTCAAWQDID